MLYTQDSDLKEKTVISKSKTRESIVTKVEMGRIGSKIPTYPETVEIALLYSAGKPLEAGKTASNTYMTEVAKTIRALVIIRVEVKISFGFVSKLG